MTMNDPDLPKPKRRFLRFSLRTLLLFVVVLSVPLGWFAWRLEKSRRQWEVVMEVQRLGAQADYGGILGRTRAATVLSDVECVGVGGDQFGDDKMSRLLTLLQRLPHLEVLHVTHSPVTDRALTDLSGLRSLRSLNFAGTQITDTGLAQVSELTTLDRLNISATRITDVGLERLHGLTNLELLFLFETQVTDEGLQHLDGLTKLKKLDLCGTAVTDEGVRRLQQALPNCEIVY
jgi:hypothetical protein